MEINETLMCRYVNMVELNSPESLSPNRLNQALISETLSEFNEFEFVPDAATTSSMPTPILVQDPLLMSPNPAKKGTFHTLDISFIKKKNWMNPPSIDFFLLFIIFFIASVLSRLSGLTTRWDL